VLDQREFRAWMQLAKVYLIHKGADKEDAAAGAAEDVFWCERIGDRAGIETWALVGDADDKRVRCGFKGRGDSFALSVGIAVHDGINRGLADSHGDIGRRVLIEAGTCRKLLRSPLQGIDAFESGRDGHGDAACCGIGQSDHL